MSPEQPCEVGNCPLRSTFSVDTLENGTHTIKLVAFDQIDRSRTSQALIDQKHRRIQEWTINVDRPTLRLVDRSKLGLEDYFAYDSTPTGAGGAAHVNLASGNVVWHKVPVVNPGQGLSSVVNLTYNSHDTDGLLGDLAKTAGQIVPSTPDLTGLSYGEVGRGFSLGISGVTRLNEPLAGVNFLVPGAPLGKISFTDPDGTQHTFTRNGDTLSYSEPAGVNLRLRRYAPVPVIVNPLDPDGSPQAWAITRADGVTYFFDEAGYARSIVDRNNNKIEFVYERYSPLLGDGLGCGDPIDLLVKLPLDGVTCAKRVAQVKDQGARVIDIQYKRRQLLDNVTLPNLGIPLAVGNKPGKIRQIVDHRVAEPGSRRVTEFVYDSDLPIDPQTNPNPQGYLRKLIEARRQSGDGAVDTSETRTTEFRYAGAGASANDQLSRVTDPRGNVTQIAHVAPNDPNPLVGGSGQPVSKVTDRRNNATGYAFAGGGSGETQTTVTDAKARQTAYTLDTADRMVRRVDPRPATMLLEWDADNNVKQRTEAAGTPDQAVTQMTYNANGLLGTRTDPESTQNDPKVLELTYRDGAGIFSTNEDGSDPTFVSDLVSIKRPEGNTTTFGLDENADQLPRGNQTSRTDGEGKIARNEFDAFGRITKETDEVSNVTTYSDFDANGLPQIVVDPKGNATPQDEADGQWRYRYDEAANTTSVTDPRGSASGPDDPYTTTLTYDVLDRMTVERRPRNTTGPDGDGARFAQRLMAFDSNDNPLSETDANASTTTHTYNAMDLRTRVTSPPLEHASGATAPEVAEFAYDEVDQLTRTTAPEGVRTTAPGDDETEYRYDAVDQKVAQIGKSSNQPEEPAQLATSWAYDLRGNQIGMADPRQNARFASLGQPEDNVKIPTRRRFAYSYDKADNRRTQAEDPGGEADTTEWTYDLNDNVDTKVDPRGNELGAEPEDFTWRYTYDGRDLPLTTESPAVDHDAEDGAARRVTRYVRREDAKITSITSPRGTATEADGDFETILDYDRAGDLISRTMARAPGQYGPVQTIRYTRNAVGDPTAVVDARKHTITNSFYDSGELRSTSRPSWWTVDEQQIGLRERTAEELLAQNGEPAQPQEAGADATSDFGDTKPAQMPDWLPKAGQTEFTYDGEMRLTGVSDAAQMQTVIGRDANGRMLSTIRPFDRREGTPEQDRSITESMAYDFNGNVVSETDGEDFETTAAFDQYDRRVSQSTPGANTGREVTKFTLDANDNVTDIRTPRSFVYEQGYDRLDRQVSETNPDGDRSTYDYDAAGNRTRLTRPRGNVDGLAPETKAMFSTTWQYNAASDMTVETNGLGHETSYAYDRNANVVRESAPGSAAQAGGDVAARVTRRTFDGRDLLWTQTTGAGDHERTRVSEFDGNGNLRRAVNPAGLNASDLPQFADDHSDSATTDFPERLSSSTDANRHATVREYSADDLLQSIVMAFGPGDGENGVEGRRRFRQDFQLDQRGRTSFILAPWEFSRENSKAQRTKYGHYETGWVRSVSDQRLLGNEEFDDPDPGDQGQDEHQHDYVYDKRGLQTQWNSDKGRRVIHDHYDNGLVSEREARRTANDDTPRRYTYEYNANRSLTKIVDPQLDGGRSTSISYDDSDRRVRVNETWRGGRDSVFAYDRDSNVTRRKVDGAIQGADSTPPGACPLESDDYAGGKVSCFDFDALDRETRAQVRSEGADDRVTTSSYWPSDDLRTHDKTGADGSRTTNHYLSDGRLSNMTRVNTAGGSVKDQDYAYDDQDDGIAGEGNGNRSRDERGTHAYNARDQLTRWTRAADQPNPGTTVDYLLNASGAMLQKTDSAVQPISRQSTQFVYTEDTPGARYVGDRLLKTIQGDVTTTFAYNPLGNVTRIASSEPGVEAVSYTYDEFERRRTSNAPGSAQDEVYEYDGLDRRDKKTMGSDTFDYSYIALSEKLTRERTGDANKIRDYDYDSQLQRLGQNAKNSDQMIGTYRSYAMDANGSVEGLEQTDGDLADADSYFYDPYGELQRDTNDPPIGDTASQAPFRFEGFYYDSAVKTYDMQARSYRPDIGRFLSADRYQDAQADLELQSDPLTQNRYAFAGGNPVNNIEIDGHFQCPGEYFDRLYGTCKDKTPAGPPKTKPSARERKRTVGRPARQSALQTLGNPRGTKREAILAELRKRPSLAQALSTIPTPNELHQRQAAAISPSRKDDGGIGGAVRDTVSQLRDAITDLPQTGLNVLNALRNPAAVARALAQSCDGHSTSYCLTTIGLGVIGTKGIGNLTKAAKGGRGALDDVGRTAARACSFSGPTAVLMADGTKKPISQIKVGDRVIATDPETGERVAKRVEHVWVHEDTLVDLVVDGEVVSTTEDHPFWSVTDQRFVRADGLTRGEQLFGRAGRGVAVSGVRPRSGRYGLAYNLSVEGIHTYHVGGSALLVHNSCYSAVDALNDPKALEGLTPSQVDDLARNARFDVFPGKASAKNPATRYYVPGTNGSEGFRVLPGGVAGQSGIKGGPYLKYFGGARAGLRVPLGSP